MKIKWMKFVSLIGAISFPMQLFGIERLEESQVEEIKMVLQDAVASKKTPGISVTVVNSKGVLLEASAGLRDLEKKTPMTADTLFGAASVSKPVAAILGVQLMEAGLIHADEKLAQYFPQMQQPISDLTIHHLISQTTGYPEFFGKTSLMASIVYENGEPPVITDSFDSVVQFLNLGKSYYVAAPGECFSYNNDFYTLLGKVYENAVGKDYELIAKEGIFAKLGMDRSTYSPENVLADSNRVTGYVKQNKKWRKGNFPFLHINDSAGGLWTTSNELGLLLQELLKTSQGNSDFLSQQALQNLWTDYSRVNWGFGSADNAAYGYAFRIATNRLGHKYFYHGGDFLVSGSYIIVVPELDLGVAIGMNSSPGNIATTVSKTIMDIASREAIGERLKKYTGSYASLKDYLQAEVSVYSNHQLKMEATFPASLGGKQQFILDIEDLEESLFVFKHERVGSLKTKFICDEPMGKCDLLFDRFFMAGVK